MDKIEELLTRGVANIIPNKEELKKILTSGKKLNIYIGIDPTTTQIHLGHAFPLRKLQAFAEMGHNVSFLIGDFTALIGDTSDKESERPILTSQQIEDNFQTYKKQASKVLDFQKIKIVHNSEWLSKLTYTETIKLMQQFSLNDFISRELIKKRLEAGKRVALHEVQYPIMQGYDSYFLDTDIQIGGTDQTFNMQAGRTLLKNWKNKESFILATEFLMGIDGRKMSKTWGNAIWLNDTPENMFAKIMSIRDDLIVDYYTFATNLELKEIAEIKQNLTKEENPMVIKKNLARTIITELYSEEEADKSATFFEKTVQKQELPKDIPIYQYIGSEEESTIDLLIKVNFASSKAEARRLIEQGGVEVDEKRVENPNEMIKIKDGMIVKVGKRKFARIAIKQ